MNKINWLIQPPSDRRLFESTISVSLHSSDSCIILRSYHRLHNAVQESRFFYHVLWKMVSYIFFFHIFMLMLCLLSAIVSTSGENTENHWNIKMSGWYDFIVLSQYFQYLSLSSTLKCLTVSEVKIPSSLMAFIQNSSNFQTLKSVKLRKLHQFTVIQPVSSGNDNIIHNLIRYIWSSITITICYWFITQPLCQYILILNFRHSKVCRHVWACPLHK